MSIPCESWITPFSGNRFDAGPVRLASMVHAFNYRVAVLRDGAKPSLRTGRSRKADRGFLENVSLQHVAVMFQIVSTLVLEVQAAAECLVKIRGIPPNVLLPVEPWGHIDHSGRDCHCLSSARTEAYVHALSIDRSPSDYVSSPLLSPQDVTAGEAVFSVEEITGNSSVLVSTEIHLVRPGSVSFVSRRASAYGRLLLATHDDGWLVSLRLTDTCDTC